MAFRDPYHQQREANYGKQVAASNILAQTTGFEQKPEERYVGSEFASEISDLLLRINVFENELKKIKSAAVGYIKINFLFGKYLKTPMDVILEPDEDGFLARLIEVPLYGYGGDPIEAVAMLKSEIESLYKDLSVDDEFTDEWLSIRQYLTRIVNEQ